MNEGGAIQYGIVGEERQDALAQEVLKEATKGRKLRNDRVGGSGSRDECLDTLNSQMLHFDEQFAAHTEWKKCLMDSTLTMKVIMGMTWKTFVWPRAQHFTRFCPGF